MNPLNPSGNTEYDGDYGETAYCAHGVSRDQECSQCDVEQAIIEATEGQQCPHGILREYFCPACRREELAELRGHADLFDLGIPKE